MTMTYKDPAFLNIKEWYCETYPNDDLGKELNSALTFSVLLKAMVAFCEFYELIGLDDSVVRQRIFQKLADICGTDYDFIFDVWLSIDDRNRALAALTSEQKARVSYIVKRA